MDPFDEQMQTNVMCPIVRRLEMITVDTVGSQKVLIRIAFSVHECSKISMLPSR